MVSGADVRVALIAGLWEALADSADRAAMRSTCRDARAMVHDMLHDTAVLPVGPDTLNRAASIADFHRQLGAVQALHVRYSAREGEEAHAVQFMEAYSAALGAALPATHCSIHVPAGRQLPTSIAEVLLQRVVPGVERLDVALGSYGKVEQLLQALEPCTHLRALRLLPAPCKRGPATAHRAQLWSPSIALGQGAGVLDALCKLTRLHTLSGPWEIWTAHLQRLCDALPSLTTLGFKELSLPSDIPWASCISRQLHTLAAWDDAAGADAACILGVSVMATTLPAVQRLKGVSLRTVSDTQDDVLSMRDLVQRYAACAHEWTLSSWAGDMDAQDLAQSMTEGCLAPLQHLKIQISYGADTACVAAMLGCLVSAAPNLATLTLQPNSLGLACATLVAMASPLRRAAHLHTLRLCFYVDVSSEHQAAALEAVVRCLAQPCAEGEGTHCRALRRVLLHDARPGVLDACRRAVGRDEITVSVDTYFASD